MWFKRLFCPVCLVWLVAACSADAPGPAPKVAGLRLNAVLGTDGDHPFAEARAPRKFVFPQDHGSHPDFRTEWWYLTAVLRDALGRDYGVQFTVFRQALAAPRDSRSGPWHLGQVYLGHLAVTDVASGRHLAAERVARGHPQLAQVSGETGLDLYLDGWQLRSHPTAGRPAAAAPALTFDLTAQHAGDARAPAFGVRLQVQQRAAIVLQGRQGLSMKSAATGSYYYSMPRLAVSGVLTLPQGEVEVQGSGWLDREWSTALLPPEVKGWDWMALNFDDGRGLMAFQLRRRDGRRNAHDHGILLAADAAAQGVVTRQDEGVRLLQAADFTLLPQRHWRDGQGVLWPVEWSLTLDGRRYVVAAMLDDQVMNTAILYWEGLVTVRDETDTPLGRGYMEMTGYGPEPQPVEQPHNINY